MFSFKNYMLLKENTEVPEDFSWNIIKYLAKLPKKLQVYFGIQCAEHVLPIWEEWAKTSILTPKQQAAPRNAIEAGKNVNYVINNI